MHIRALATFLAWCTFIGASWCCTAATARAQPLGRTVVVPYFIGDSAAAALELAKEADTALRAKGTTVISLHDARDRFIVRSREPQAASPSEIDTLAKEAHLAIEHVAFGRTAAAERSLRRVVELAERSLETIDRETATARTLLDACLSLVRAYLHDNKRDEAIEQAMRCRRLVPDLAPGEVAHPATVVGALAEADDQLRRMRVGRLNVQVRPERACEVYLNGRQLGHTPFFLDRAPVGEYRVQVECPGARPGRVHNVQLGDEPAQLSIDTQFDESVRTDPRLALRYATTQDARSALMTHALLAGREVRAEDVLLVGVIDDQPTILRAQVRHERLVGGATLAADGSASVLPAIELVEHARFSGVQPEDYEASEQPANASGSPSASTSAADLPRPSATPAAAGGTRAPPSRAGTGLLWAGGAALAVGLGAEVAAWLFYRDRVAKGEELLAGLSNDDSGRDSWEEARAPMFGLGAAGAGLAGAGVALLALAEPERKVPWWLAGIAGGVGAGLATWGIVDIAKGDACGTRDDARECVVGEQQRDRGVLLLTSAIPMLVLPVVKAGRSRAVEVATTMRGVHVHGSW